MSAAVLMAAVILYFMTRTPPSESPPTAVAEAPAADGARVDGADVTADADPGTEAARRSPVSAEPPIATAVVTGTRVLRVVLEELTEEDARMTTVALTAVDKREESSADVRDSWPCQASTSEFDLDPFFAEVAKRHEDLRVDELEVTVDHPLHLIEKARVPLSDGVERKSGQTVYEVRVRLTPAAVIHGHVVRAGGTPAAEGLVGAILLEGDFPIEAEGRAVECAADGAFELRVPASGRHALASYEDGLRPTTTRMDAQIGERVDVGTLVLEAGHAITGHALRQGKPLAGATLSASPPTNKTANTPEALAAGMHWQVYEGRTFATTVRSVHLLWLPPNFTPPGKGTGFRQNGRFELPRQRVHTNDAGAFAFRGLGAGEYLLRMRGLAESSDGLPGSWDDTDAEGRFRINGDRPALIVCAPEHGLEFELRWTSVRFEFAGDLATEGDGRLLLKSPCAFATPVDENGVDLRLVANPLAKGLNFMGAFHARELRLPANEPTHVLQAPPNKHITGEVTFPGRQPVPLDFRTPDPGGQVVVPVQLVPSEAPATLMIELENPRAELPDACRVMLWRAGMDAFPPDTRSVEVADGQLRVDGVLAGKYRVRVVAGKDYYSAGLFHGKELEVELHPGLVVTRSIEFPQGAGLRFTVRGDDGALLGGEYEFFDHAVTRRVSLTAHVRGDGRRWVSTREFYPHGPNESCNELHPGSYKLLLRSLGYAEQMVTVELRAGEYEDVYVTLSK